MGRQLSRRMHQASSTNIALLFVFITVTNALPWESAGSGVSEDGSMSEGSDGGVIQGLAEKLKKILYMGEDGKYSVPHAIELNNGKSLQNYPFAKEVQEILDDVIPLVVSKQVLIVEIQIRDKLCNKMTQNLS